MKKIILYSVLFSTGMFIGIIADRNKSSLIDGQFIRDHFSFRKKIDLRIITPEKTMVCLTFGQSNAGNYANGSFLKQANIFNYYKGDLYEAEEPLLGTDGAGISVWTRVASKLIANGNYEKVIIVPIAVGMTSINQWVEGDCRKKLERALAELKKDDIQLTHILWTQGETDNVEKTTKEQYKKSLFALVDIFRNQGIDAPFYTSITSYFPYHNSNPYGISKAITEAQIESINERSDIFAGPNTDSLNLAYYRKEAVHFTEAGLDIFASKWYKRITEQNNFYKN